MTLLAHLSLQRVDGHRRVASVPTNEERVRAFRHYQPVQFANAALNDHLRAIEREASECIEVKANECGCTQGEAAERLWKTYRPEVKKVAA